MDLAEQLRREREKVRSIQEIARAIGSTLDLDELLHLIVGTITRLMDADRSTLYVLDDSGTELWTRVLQAEELKEIRLKWGEGVAGWVAKSGETVNIADAYADERFSRDTDQRSGYRTRSILCTPLKDNAGSIIGVMQVLNKKGDVPFTVEDEELLAGIVSQAGIALENSQLYLAALRKNQQLIDTQQKLQRRMRELDLLLDVEQTVNQASSLASLLQTLLDRTAQLGGVEAASILLRSETRGRLYFSTAVGERSDEVKELLVDTGQGIAGWVVQHGKPAVVNDPETDPRYAQDIADRLHFYPRNLLCVPLVGQDGVLGAMELLNKRLGSREFDDGDLRLLTLIAGRVAKAIELSRSQEDQVKQGRLAAIGQLLAGVLHDLKTPMTVISGYAQLMAQSPDETVRHEYVEQILRQFSLLQAMTAEVLAFARGESKVLLRKTYLNTFMRDTINALKHEFADSNIELQLDQAYRGVAYLDQHKFHRVFHNIGRNAAQAMPDGGRFTVGVATADERLVLTFADTGRGIPAELEGRLFEAFASSGKDGGTGLGLAIVKKIVDEHDGDIRYERNADGGATFTITVPLNRHATTSSDEHLASA